MCGECSSKAIFQSGKTVLVSKKITRAASLNYERFKRKTGKKERKLTIRSHYSSRANKGDIVEVRNMNEHEANILQNVVHQMQKVSPAIKYRTFIDGIEQKMSDVERLDILEVKIDRMAAMLERIFGDFVLIDGRFTQL